MLAAVVVLLVGVVASVLGAVAWGRHVRRQAASAFQTSASSVSATLATEVRRDSDFVAVQRAAIATLPSITNVQLGSVLRSIDVTKRYPGTLGFGAYVRVPAAGLAAFEAQVVADPPVDLPVAAPYTVIPPGNRPFYCLLRYGYTTSAAKVAIPATFDLCSPEIPGSGANPIPPVLAQATDSGQTAVLAGNVFGPGLVGLIVVFDPAYAGGGVPPTVDARRSALEAWDVGTFSGTQLIRTATTGHPDLAVTLTFREPGGASVRAAAVGTVPAGPVFTSTSAVSSDGRWTTRIVGSASTSAAGQALAAGALGVVVSLLLFLLFALMARSRGRALRVVEERTGELRHLALHDPLTGLPNRSLILDRAEQMLARAGREARSVGALYVDIDNFKDVNDAFGHEAGDALLRSTARRLATALRASDTVGRLGGDEFVVLAEGDAGDAGPELVAERVMAVMDEPFRLTEAEPAELTVGVSIGVALGERADAAELLHDADVALYEAKAHGKHRIVVFLPAMQSAVEERMGLELDLRRALDAGQLHLLYQPTFDLDEMSVTGVEALIRWRHPERGELLPADFLPIAEETGLIVPIGRFVLAEACAQASAWHAAGYPIPVSVNVSGRQLEDAGLADDVRTALDESGLDPSFLTIEIGEPVLVRNAPITSVRMGELKELGVHVAVDAFGTGYSSLAYLGRFPVDALKIDRSFVGQAGESRESGALMRALAQLGRSLAIETLAQGIEDPAQLEHARQARCDLGQGFLLARPLDPAGVEDLLAERSVREPSTARPTDRRGRQGRT